MENFIVESFNSTKARPLKKESFHTINECNRWCDKEILYDAMWFEIHHSIGAISYLEGIVSSGVDDEITWFEKIYAKREMPSVKPWWKITDLPARLER